jgi:hypothetical protein
MLIILVRLLTVLNEIMLLLTKISCYFKWDKFSMFLPPTPLLA